VTTTPRSLLRRLLGARGAALLSTGARDPGRTLIVVGILATALWCGALARADTTPSPTTPTTTTEAPPPDPYKTPARTAKKQPAPRHVSVTRSAPVARTRTYTPPAVAQPRPAVRTSRPKVQRHARVVRKPRKRPAHAKPVRISLAPLAGILATVRDPLPQAADENRPFRLLAGIALVVLAATGLSLVVLVRRFERLGVLR